MEASSRRGKFGGSVLGGRHRSSSFVRRGSKPAQIRVQAVAAMTEDLIRVQATAAMAKDSICVQTKVAVATKVKAEVEVKSDASSLCLGVGMTDESGVLWWLIDISRWRPSPA
jgi:hypothetical protein|uniref:Uncharacterized protein n=1 Tax=Zea mays TaxID=4577 RepID=A0A804NKJ3_MAIZE